MKLFLFKLIAVFYFAAIVGARQGPPRDLSALDRELLDFSDRLFSADVNGLGNFIVLNLQAKGSKNNEDKAQKPLFTEVPFAKMSALPTYASLLAMYDNYEAAVEKPEIVTSVELAEEERFLDAVLATDVMKKTHQFLVSKGKAPAELSKFRQYLRDIWFGLYSRAQGVPGSSGFEHVFLGELKHGVSGLHSWIRYSLEEKKGNMNYLGYLHNIPLGDDALIELPIYWNRVFKSISSILVGVSPELELALYTACFVLEPNRRCPVQHKGKTFYIQTHTIQYQGKTYIGSAYPTL